MVTHSFRYDARLYRVDIQQQERDGVCVQRRVFFTSYSRLYVEPHLNRVRAVDEWCDAIYVSNFESFQIMRDPVQQDRYQNNRSFRSRVDEGLWDAYQTALFQIQWERRRGQAE